MYTKYLAAFIAAVFVGAFQSSALALERVDLKAEAFKDARGEITISEESREQRRLEVNLTGLEPNAVYTLWFTGEREGQRATVGKESTFRSDSTGKAVFSTVVSENEIEKWDRFEVAYHPDGNPKNLKGSINLLSGDLPEEG